MRLSLRLILLFSLVATAVNSAHSSDPAIWDSLKSGNHFALMRHAIAPGMGDPPNFMVDDCSTQRNLSDGGRDQARAVGDAFRANGVERAQLYSSQWCRCLETARWLSLGAVQELPILNSFFRQYNREETQTTGLKEWLEQQDLSMPTLLVTHQVNITALTNVTPRSGEIVVVKRLDSGELMVVGRYLVGQ